MDPRPSVTVAVVIERGGQFLLVLRCVEDYLAGRRYPLDALIEHG